VTLLTDFGTVDWFVGVMKGVIATIAPTSSIVDLTHQIPPGDIRAGAFALTASCRFFPRGTVHVAVVDPGVGSDRKAIAVQTADYLFVGPDNGVLSWALQRESIRSIHALENKARFLKPLSRTFHGRDIFAPVAAHLSRGLAIEKLGPDRNDFVRLEWPQIRRTERTVRGEIIYVDRFGNVITNLDAATLSASKGTRAHVFTRGKRLCPLAPFYQSVGRDKPVGVLGSSGFLEIAVNDGNASKQLKLGVGSKVEVRFQ
jgi:S-adenosyl-L-methionine hydrolase (adenosine-forming)